MWHYGFTGGELTFIINYDIKYRMGKSSAEKGRCFGFASGELEFSGKCDIKYRMGRMRGKRSKW